MYSSASGSSPAVYAAGAFGPVPAHLPLPVSRHHRPASKHSPLRRGGAASVPGPLHPPTPRPRAAAGAEQGVCAGPSEPHYFWQSPHQHLALPSECKCWHQHYQLGERPPSLQRGYWALFSPFINASPPTDCTWIRPGPRSSIDPRWPAASVTPNQQYTEPNQGETQSTAGLTINFG